MRSFQKIIIFIGFRGEKHAAKIEEQVERELHADELDQIYNKLPFDEQFLWKTPEF